MAVKQPQNFSTGGIGGSAYIETMMLTHALKLPIKMLSGYYGGDDYGAMRRGEVIGTISSRSTWEQFVSNGYARFIAQIGGTSKDAPQLRDLVTDADPKAKALIALVQSQGDLQRFTAGPPGIPKGPARRVARRLQKGAGGSRTAGQGRQARSAGRSGLWRRSARGGEGGAEPAAGNHRAAQADLAAAEGATPPTVKGAVTEWDGRAKIALKMDEGDTFRAEISGSRTEITIGGQKSPAREHQGRHDLLHRSAERRRSQEHQLQLEEGK